MTDEASAQDFYNTAWKTPARIAEHGIEKRLATFAAGDRTVIHALDAEGLAEEAVEYVFDALAEPDRDMISAGISALEQASNRRRPIEQRELVALVFQAMLRAAR